MEFSNLFINASDFVIQSNEFIKGPHGSIHIVEKIENGIKYAAKIINIENNFDGNEQALFLKKSLIMQKLNHLAIVKFIGINFMSLVDHELHRPTIITDYLQNGSLKDIFDNEANSLSKQYWTTTKKYINLLGICDALRYLHDQRITHSNLKPENILLDIEYHPHVSDYYLSKCFPAIDKNLTNEGQFDNSIYLAPEILQGNDDYDESTDVYAFAMIAYQIITEKVPFNEINDSSSLKNKIINGDRPEFLESVPQEMQNLLSRCWSDIPEERPKFKEIFSILSGDMKYSFEKVDEKEIQRYIDMINDSKEEQINISEKYSIEEQIDELKSAMFLCFYKKLKSRNGEALMAYYAEEAAKTNNKDRLIELGNELINSHLFLDGFDNYSNAKYCYEKALKLGSTKAYEGLGDIYYHGYGVNKDYSKALYYYEKAYKSGNLYVCNNLYNIYRYGYGVDKNPEKSNEFDKIRKKRKNAFDCDQYLIILLYLIPMVCLMAINMIFRF